VWRGLSHQNIIEYHTEDIQPPFIEVEYAGGGSLAEADKPMPLESACELLLKVSEGLSHAHGQNRTHGDIKPSNVLLTSGGQPKLSDWGLGRVLMDTPLGYSGGMSRHFAPYYAAPEHFNRGESLDFKTDVYQLGVLGYELVTGSVPFPADDYDELRQQIIHDDPPRPSDADQRYEPIDEIILPCLAKSRDGRPDLREVRRQLAQFLGQSYSRSLQEFAVTRNTRNSLIAHASLATLRARLDEYSECLLSLRDLEDSAKGTERPDLIEDIVDLANAVETYQGLNLKMAELIKRFEGVEHTVQTM
jgi:serine/threonine protein kinase